MKNRIIALVVGMILLLFSFLSADPYSEPVNPFENTQSLWVDSLNLNLIGMWNYGYYCQAIYRQGNILYLGCGGGVMVFDISDNLNPEVIGNISFPGEYVDDVFATDSFLVVADGEKGLRIANTANPVLPFEIGSYDSSFVHKVYGKNNNTIVAAQYDLRNGPEAAELAVYDISNPENPIIIGKTAIPSWDVTDLEVRGDYAYASNGFQGLRIIDISDSTNPFEAGSFIPPIYSYSIKVCNDSLLLLTTAKMGANNGGLWTINIKDPYNPYAVGCDTFHELFSAVSCHMNYGYVNDLLGNSLKIFDISDPAVPFVVGQYDPPFNGWLDLNTNKESTIYIGESWRNCLRTINAANPTNPVEADYDAVPNMSMDVAVQANYAYVANNASGFYILDISNPQDPQQISHIDTRGFCNSVIVRDSIAYFADSSEVLIFNVSDPYNPVKIGDYPIECDGFGLALDFPNLYVTSGFEHHFAVIDVSTPQAPFMQGICNLSGTYLNYMCIKDSFAYVCAPAQGLAVIDIKNANNPHLETYLPLSGHTRGIASKGDYLFVANFDTTFIYIIDINVPNAPVLLDSFWTIEFGPSGISISDTLLYVPMRLNGIQVFNISSPLSPHSIAYYRGDPLTCPLSVKGMNDQVYLAAANGMFLFQYTGASGKKETEKNMVGSNVLLACHPNPFTSATTICLSSSQAHKSTEAQAIHIYDISGRLVRSLVPGDGCSGALMFNGRDDAGKVLPPGIYFLKLNSKPVGKVVKVR